MEKVNINSEKLMMRDTFWDYGKRLEQDRRSGLSWPQRNYRCSFCKKEFKSAQALGGHMNVHRRDRAKMRLSPSWDSLNTNPNPNISSCSSPPPVAKFLPYLTHCSSLTSFSSPSSASKDEQKVAMISHSQCDNPVIKRRDVGKNLNKRALLELTELPAVLTKRNDYSLVWMKEEVVKLDLSMGLMGEEKDDDLDLELRLGLA